MTITLYDIPSTIPGNAWTPNPFKARAALNYKGIPYKTEWVEYPDIERVSKKIGALPTEKRRALDGSGRLDDRYTLPMIHDSNTGKVISDSFAIVQYLDSTYPNTPQLLPQGTHAAITLFNEFVITNIAKPLTPLVIPTVQKRLNERSREYFLNTREFWNGKRLEDMSPPGVKREELWREVKKGLTILAGFYEKNKNANDHGSGGDMYFIANRFTYADIIIGSFLCWPRVVLFEEDFDWKDIADADGGLWGRVVRELEKYRQVL